MSANIAIKSELPVILPIIFSIFCKASPNLHFLSVARKKTEAKERVRKRPELRGRNHNFSKHSMNSLRSNSISYFVTQIAFAIRDSILLQKIILPINASSCGMFSRKRNDLKNIPHEEVFRSGLRDRTFFRSFLFRPQRPNQRNE